MKRIFIYALAAICFAAAVMFMFMRTTSYDRVIGSFSTNFGDSVNKDCQINLFDNLSSLEFSYTNFNLKKGEIQIKLISSDGKVCHDMTLKTGDKKKGSFAVSGLKGGQEYTLIVTGSEVGSGKIDIKWEAVKSTVQTTKS